MLGPTARPMGKTTDDRMRVLWLRERFRWMGAHSGYDLLFRELSGDARLDAVSVYADADATLRLPEKAVFSLIRRAVRDAPGYSAKSARSEVRAALTCVRHRSEVVHVAYVENDLGLLCHLGRVMSVRLLGTAHQPPSWWLQRRVAPKRLDALDALIVMSELQGAFFREYLPGRVHVIRHGVDIAFFRPRPYGPTGETPSGETRCLFAGGWLRDGETLARVIEEVGKRDGRIVFDLLLPPHFRKQSGYERLAHNDRVSWHSGLTDEELRSLHWRASLLLLPLIDCTANNAMLEAMACGLPIVSTDVGAAREYVGDAFATLCPPQHVDGLVDAVLSLAGDPAERARRGAAARAHAEAHYGWAAAAEATLQVYAKLLER